MSHHYKLRTLIEQITIAAGQYTQSAQGDMTQANRANLISLTLSTIVGFRKITPVAFAASNGEEAARMDNSSAIKCLLSQVGEQTYINPVNTLSVANKIYQSRWERFSTPIVSFSEGSTKAYLEAQIEGSSDFVYSWLERGSNVIECYIEEHNRGA